VHHDIAGAGSTSNAPQLVPVTLSMQCKGAAAAAADWLGQHDKQLTGLGGNSGSRLKIDSTVVDDTPSPCTYWHLHLALLDGKEMSGSPG
jgi:hypothetical protein